MRPTQSQLCGWDLEKGLEANTAMVALGPGILWLMLAQSSIPGSIFPGSCWSLDPALQNVEVGHHTISPALLPTSTARSSTVSSGRHPRTEGASGVLIYSWPPPACCCLVESLKLKGGLELG